VIGFCVKKFHRYLYGRKFSLATYHKPLTTILGPKNGIPLLAAACLQRWAVLLSAHDYNICYKSTTDHGNASGLSRLPLPSATPLMDTSGATSSNIGQIQALPVIFRDIQKATRRDAILATSMCKKDVKIKLQMNYNHTKTERGSSVLRVVV